MWPDNYSKRLWETSKKKMNFAFDDDVVLLQSGLSEPGGPGGHITMTPPWPPRPWFLQISAEPLNLSQPGGPNYNHHITTCYPKFSDLPTALYQQRKKGSKLNHINLITATYTLAATATTVPAPAQKVNFYDYSHCGATFSK